LDQAAQDVEDVTTMTEAGTTYMQSITVPSGNNGRTITFVGQEIARVSTRRGHVGRWTEMAVYRTVDGYVLETVGRSIVYHAPDCPSAIGRTNFRRIDEIDDVPNDEAFPCDICDPNDELMGPAVQETDKHKAIVLSNVEYLFNALSQRDRHTGKLRVTRLAQELVMEAAKVDDDIARVARLRGQED
jgi:hypothetical protein